jgi:hypothetical protein
MFNSLFKTAISKELKDYKIESYEDFFKALEEECVKGVNFFDELFGKKIRKR